MKKLIFFLFLGVNNICFGQLLNSSFENWTLNADSSSQPGTLNDWIHCDKQGNPFPMNAGLLGTYRDSIAQSGSFALTLSRWYANTYDIVKFKNECSNNPTLLNGFYRYSDNALSNGVKDTALIQVYLTKNNSISQVTDTISSGSIELVTAINYTLFECPIIYSQLNLSPDSILIIIQPSKFGFGVNIPICLSGSYCSYLTVDDINLSFSTGTTQVISQSPFLIYPNPASSSISITGEIRNKKITITNVLGGIVFGKVATSNNEIIGISNLSKGVYFLNINGKTEKFVVE